MLTQAEQHISPEEYLAGEREAATRHEYFAGEIFAMAGASREHNQISANIVRLLGNQLLERPCSVFASDMKVKIKKRRNTPTLISLWFAKKRNTKTSTRMSC